MDDRVTVAARTKAGAGVLSPPTLLVLGLGFLLMIRILGLATNATDLFFDEAQYWSWSRALAFGYYSKPPLIAGIIGIATAACGDSTACIRLPAPLLHTATAAVVYLIGKRLHGARVGLWSALAFATLPGVSLSSGIISTDVPLLACWAVALWALIAIEDSDSGWAPAILLGLALGLGLNAKYAMVFFLACLAVYLVVTPGARRLLGDPRLWVGLGLGGLLIAPNLAWNVSNSFATFAHTADNARLGGSLLNIGKGLEFVAAQFGVFGPILFAGLIVTAARAWREGLPEADRFLLCFTLPVLLLISAQAFLSRAHANWAAVAYVAGAILVTSTLMRLEAKSWLQGSLALHSAVAIAFVVATAFAGRFTLPVVGDPFQRTLGWRALADDAGRVLDAARRAGQPYKAVMADDRSVTAELLYYLRHDPTPIVAWRDSGRPRDHYEMTRAFRDPTRVPILLISIRRDATAITSRFATVDTIADRSVPAGLGEPRRFRLLSLSDYRR